MPPDPAARPLSSAFALKPTGELVAFTGGGGKTSLLFALSRELAAAGRRVIATTTTRIASYELLRAPAHCLVEQLGADLAPINAMLRMHNFIVVVGAVGNEKAKSVPLDLPARLLAHPAVDHVLVEADGAKMLPVKAPAPHEPPIPPQTSLLVPVTGIDALSSPLQEIAHRPQILADLLHISLHETLQPRHIAALLNSPHAALRNAPPQARIIPFINKVETPEQLALAHEIARCLFDNPQRDSRIQRLLIGAAQRPDPILATVQP